MLYLTYQGTQIAAFFDADEDSPPGAALAIAVSSSRVVLHRQAPCPCVSMCLLTFLPLPSLPILSCLYLLASDMSFVFVCPFLLWSV